MTERRSSTPWLIAAFLCGCLAAAWFSPRTVAPSPWLPTPFPNPHESRPILAQIVRLAKAVGWFALMAQPAPEEPDAVQRVAEVEEEPETVGADGHVALRNARGW
jgi:hypothetical protein